MDALRNPSKIVEGVDGLLGSATGTFRNGELIRVDDTFNFDNKDRSAWYLNAAVYVLRFDAKVFCGAGNDTPVYGVP